MHKIPEVDFGGYITSMEQKDKDNNYSSQQYFGSKFSASYAYPCIEDKLAMT